MDTPPHAEHAQQAQHAHLHLPAPVVVRWQRARTCYRDVNLATHHVLGFVGKTTLLVYFAFAIVLLLLRYLVLPNIDLYNPVIERLAGRALGNQVSIARIYATWDGLRPALFLAAPAPAGRPGRAASHHPKTAPAATRPTWHKCAQC